MNGNCPHCGEESGFESNLDNLLIDMECRNCGEVFHTEHDISWVGDDYSLHFWFETGAR